MSDENKGVSWATWFGTPNTSPTIPYVLQFAAAMEAKLEKNRHRGNREGWIKMSPWDLLRRLRQEVIELEVAMEDRGDPADITREAADVANFAMMVADSYRASRRNACHIPE